MTDFIRAYCERAETDTVEPGTPIRFSASTSGIKRDGLDLNPANFALDNFRKNPVFLWAHDFWGSRLPIGRVEEIAVEPERLVADVVFDQQDEFARLIESKYRRRFLNAVSISWDDVKVEGGVRHELLEISGVPVPADPDALAERERSGLVDLRRSLDTLFTENESGASPVLPSDAGVWGGVASAMLALYRPDLAMEDDARRALYHLLERLYRKLGKQPPEFRTLDYLAALSEDQINGLFLEGEAEAVRADPETDPDADPDAADPVDDDSPAPIEEPAPDITADLRAIRDWLATLKGA